MVAMTREVWVARALGRTAGRGFAGFGAFGALPAPAKTPAVGAIPPLDVSQVATREVAQQIADSMSHFARGAFDAGVRSLNAAPGFPDAAAWKTRLEQQSNAAVGYRNQVFQSTAAMQISWAFVKTTLQNAWSSANMALATSEQIYVAVHTWQTEQAQLVNKAVSYSEEGYLGQAIVRDLGDHARPDRGPILVGRSWRVPRGVIVTLYPTADFAGPSKVLTADTPRVDIGSYRSFRVETQAMAAQRAQAEADARRMTAQLAAQQAQLDATRQMLELQRQLAEQQGATAEETAAQRSAEAELAAAQAALDAWTAAHQVGGDVNVSVSAGGGGGGGLMPDDVGLSASTGEPAVPKILLYALAGLAALKILKG